MKCDSEEHAFIFLGRRAWLLVTILFALRRLPYMLVLDNRSRMLPVSK